MENFISINSHANDERWHILTYFAVGGVVCSVSDFTNPNQFNTTEDTFLFFYCYAVLTLRTCNHTLHGDFQDINHVEI